MVGRGGGERWWGEVVVGRGDGERWWRDVVVGRGGGERWWRDADLASYRRGRHGEGEREKESVEWRFNKILQIRIFARVV